MFFILYESIANQGNIQKRMKGTMPFSKFTLVIVRDVVGLLINKFNKTSFSNFSSTLEILGRMEIGRKLLTLRLLPVLKTETTLAVLKVRGKTAISKAQIK